MLHYSKISPELPSYQLNEEFNMSRETFFIGSAPYEEDCAQTIDPDFAHQNLIECRAYLGQIIREYGKPPTGSHVALMSQNHDFGVYREVVVNFDPEDEESVKYASLVEGGLPKWDEAALEQLKSEKN
jgi:hypothetical protein